MYRLLCYTSYGLIVWTLLSGFVALGIANEAWARRHDWVTWWDGPGWVGLFRAKLFPPDAQAVRRRAARWQVAVLASGVAGLILAIALSGRPARPLAGGRRAGGLTSVGTDERLKHPISCEHQVSALEHRGARRFGRSQFNFRR